MWLDTITKKKNIINDSWKLDDFIWNMEKIDSKKQLIVWWNNITLESKNWFFWIYLNWDFIEWWFEKEQILDFIKWPNWLWVFNKIEDYFKHFKDDLDFKDDFFDLIPKDLQSSVVKYLSENYEWDESIEEIENMKVTDLFNKFYTNNNDWIFSLIRKFILKVDFNKIDEELKNAKKDLSNIRKNKEFSYDNWFNLFLENLQKRMIVYLSDPFNFNNNFNELILKFDNWKVLVIDDVTWWDTWACIGINLYKDYKDFKCNSDPIDWWEIDFMYDWTLSEEDTYSILDDVLKYCKKVNKE